MTFNVLKSFQIVPLVTGKINGTYYGRKRHGGKLKRQSQLTKAAILNPP
jgi:hypothetical protein